MIALSSEDQIKIIQLTLGVTPDGIWGPKSQAALDTITFHEPADKDRHDVLASAFAYPEDIAAFKKCKAKGKSDQECFNYGDNGIGCWNDRTALKTGPSCALPPELMEQKWGTVENAKHKEVLVQRKENRKEVVCILKDKMPSVENLSNEAQIDLNPDACLAIGLKDFKNVMEPVSWWWQE